jgi:hypothetical protein
MVEFPGLPTEGEDPAAFIRPAVAMESRVATGFAASGFLTDGKRSCETAITISERKRARKKRLSIQGTGS